MEKGIDVLLDENYLSIGITKYITWYPSRAIHGLLVGATGSGKTYFSKLFLGKISLYIPDSQIYLADFKGDNDFYFLNGCEHFFRFQDCQNGLEKFYQLLLSRQQGEDKRRNFLLLFFDEWASYISFLDKKQAEEDKKKLSVLLMLGRSFNIHVILSMQRPDAQYFGTSRDNLQFICALGNLSEEGREMLFHDYKKEILPNRKQGTGYLLVNGSEFTPVQVPSITNIDKLHNLIKQAVTRI